MTELPGVITGVLVVVVIALAARLLVDDFRDLSYAVVLVVAGIVFSATGLSLPLEFSHDIIMMVLLPTLLFQGATELDLGQVRENVVLVLALVVIGLPAMVVVLGAAAATALGLPFLLALLFAAMIIPTDPASILELFEELDAPERLSAIIESESLLNDGVGIVVFATFLELVRRHADNLTGATPAPLQLLSIGTDLLVVGVGGFLVGAAAGYAAHHTTRHLEDRMATVLVTVVLAYGSFFVVEHHLNLSGVLATVGAGMLMGTRGGEFTLEKHHVQFMVTVWDTAAFLVHTFLYFLVGATVPLTNLVTFAPHVALALVLVVLARAAVVYPLLTALGGHDTPDVSLNYQHIMVWGGLHTVIPIALALSLPGDVPRHDFLLTLVFGVAVAGMVIQGLLMPVVLRRLGLGD